MTQAEAELIAREIRNRCLRSSWSDLVAFWQSVIDNLESAYHAAVLSTAPLPRTPSGDSSDITQRMVRDKLAIALSQLAGERQVARWEAEAASVKPTSAHGQGADTEP
jgi:hypothetical protein